MKILRAAEVANKTGMSPASVWAKAKDDSDFPKPVKVSANITGWVEAEVDAFLERRVADSRKATA